MKHLRKKAISFLKSKAGITANAKLMAYQASLTHMGLPEILPLDDEVVARAKGLIKNNFDVEDFNTAVHKNDVMFNYHLYQSHGQMLPALYGHYAVGANVSGNLLKIVKAYELQSRRILDFGSGYGRVSRFLPYFFPQAEILVSEVKQKSLDFQRDLLGFDTILHTAEPGSFNSGNFDLILVGSVFTHLPKHLFEGWFHALYEALAPGAALVFTYKDGKSETKALHSWRLEEGLSLLKKFGRQPFFLFS